MKLSNLAAPILRCLFVAAITLAGLSPAFAQTTLSVSDVRIMEGNSAGEKQMEFVVTLNLPSNGAQGFSATTEMSTSTATAKAGSDYIATSITNYIFPAGS